MRKDIRKKQLLRTGAVRLRTAFYRAYSSNARFGGDCGRRANSDEPQMAWQVVLVQEAVRRDALFILGKRVLSTRDERSAGRR